MFVLNLDVLAVKAVKYQATYLEILLFFPLLPLPPLPCQAFCWFIIIMTQCLFPTIVCHIEDCWWYLIHWSSTSVYCISHLTLFSLAQVKMILTVYGTKGQSCIWVNCCEKNTPEVVSVVSHSRTILHFFFFFIALIFFARFLGWWRVWCPTTALRWQQPKTTQWCWRKKATFTLLASTPFISWVSLHLQRQHTSPSR